MLLFEVADKIEVPLYKKGQITSDLVRDKLWPSHKLEARSSGCYIFAVPRKRSDGLIPIYVGKSARPFKDECFTADKLTKINRFLLDHQARHVYLILVKHPRTRGRINERAINELEANLIKWVVAVNPHLINRRGIRPENWGIRGVLRGGRGRSSRNALLFKEMVQMNSESPRPISSSLPLNPAERRALPLQTTTGPQPNTVTGRYC